jgi:hypothetical protein
MVCGILADPYEFSNHWNHVRLIKMEAEYPSENSELLTTAESGTPKKAAMTPENYAVYSEELSSCHWAWGKTKLSLCVQAYRLLHRACRDMSGRTAGRCHREACR